MIYPMSDHRATCRGRSITQQVRSISRRRFLIRATAAGAAWALWRAGACRGQDDVETAAADMVTPATQTTINRGLSFLAEGQHQDGSFGSTGNRGNVAICGLSGMAFLSSGSVPGRGPYAENVEKCVAYILANTQDSGYIIAPDSAERGPMYGHGFATLFLGETYGMSAQADIRSKLAKAVRLIIDSQNKEGGWRYTPQSTDADISVTVCQIMALRSARNAGIHVPRETIDRSIDYVKRCQNADGGFMYMLGADQSAFPRSAAALVALYSAGVYEGPEITRGLQYVMRFLPREKEASVESHFFYGHYYAIQAMWHAGKEQWTQWYPTIRDRLLAGQRDNGSWMDAISPEYGTAMACLILQTPNNYLPIFQR